MVSKDAKDLSGHIQNMIKETTQKINFSSYEGKKGRSRDESAPVIVSVDAKWFLICFSARAIEEMNMNNKFIKFYHESTKKIIGWQLTDRLDEIALKSKKYRLVNQNKTTGEYKASISGILKQFMNVEPIRYKCEVKKYRETSDILTRGEEFFFVQLKNQKDI